MERLKRGIYRVVFNVLVWIATRPMPVIDDAGEDCEDHGA